MKHQALFSSNDKSKELKCRLLQFLFGALRVMGNGYTFIGYISFDFLFVSVNKEALQKGGLLLKERLFSCENKFFP